MLKKITLANTPTPIQKIQFMETDLPVNLYFKRDDLTGSGLSGNKIRKLEYLLQKAISDGITDIITCGGIQSNHCRATALACARLGLEAHLLLAGNEEQEKEGNNFLDILAGGKQRFISEKEYDEKRDSIMEEWKREIEEESDKKALVIPMGASCGLGSFGYSDCFEEILLQEKEMGISFDSIVITVGSGGSLAGLIYGNEKNHGKKEILGISIAASREEAIEGMVLPILEEMKTLDEVRYDIKSANFDVINGYQGLGYAKSTIEELEFIRDFVSQTGIILDPVYTGKATYGLISEILNGRWSEGRNILFVHTGGAFGWTREQIKMLLSI